MFIEHSERALYFQGIEYWNKSISSDMSRDEKFETSVPQFNGDLNHDLHLWSIRVKVVPPRKELYMALSDETMHSDKNEKALSLIMSALGDHPLRMILECLSAKAA